MSLSKSNEIKNIYPQRAYSFRGDQKASLLVFLNLKT